LPGKAPVTNTFGELVQSAFLQKGMTEDRCFSDAFNFTPDIKKGRGTGS
jgi:hypothetical protein